MVFHGLVWLVEQHKLVIVHVKVIASDHDDVVAVLLKQFLVAWLVRHQALTETLGPEDEDHEDFVTQTVMAELGVWDLWVTWLMVGVTVGHQIPPAAEVTCGSY